MTLAKGMNKQGLKIEVAGPDNSSLFRELSDNNIKVHPIDIVGPLKPGRDLTCIAQIRKILTRGNYDIVHCHGSKAGMLGRIAASLSGCKNIVLTVHNFIIYPEINPAKKLIFKYGEKILSRKTSKIITVSSALQSDLIDNFKIPREKIIPIYNGININKYLEKYDKAKTRKKLGIDVDINVVGTLARMAPQKGLEYLIKAAPAVCKEANAVFVIAGDGPLMPEFKKLAYKLGVGDRVLFPGFIINTAEFFSCLDIFLVPSIAEGLSITTIEAMTTGLPVIASRVGGLPELITHGITGLLVEPRDPSKLAETILELLKDPIKRAKMAQMARDIAASKFSEDTMIARTCEVYSALLDTRHR